MHTRFIRKEVVQEWAKLQMSFDQVGWKTRARWRRHRLRQGIAGVMLALSTMGLSVGATNAVAQSGTKPTETPTATITTSPTPTATVTSSPSPTPTQTLTPTVSPTPTLILSEVERATSRYTIDKVMPWGAVVETLLSGDEPFGLDLVLAVMAAESGGDPNLVSYAGACGLMQVMPKVWMEESHAQLCNNPISNIGRGIYILSVAESHANIYPDPLRWGLAIYNCGETGVAQGLCGSTGGLVYADHVLDFWLPLIRERLAFCESEYGKSFYEIGSAIGVVLTGCTW